MTDGDDGDHSPFAVFRSKGQGGEGILSCVHASAARQVCKRKQQAPEVFGQENEWAIKRTDDQ